MMRNSFLLFKLIKLKKFIILNIAKGSGQQLFPQAIDESVNWGKLSEW